MKELRAAVVHQPFEATVIICEEGMRPLPVAPGKAFVQDHEPAPESTASDYSSSDKLSCAQPPKDCEIFCFPWKVVNMHSPEFDGVLECSSFPNVPVVSSSRHAVKKCKMKDIQKQLELTPAIYWGYCEKVIPENTSEADHDSDMDWPPQSPDLNPDKNLWALLKKFWTTDFNTTN